MSAHKNHNKLETIKEAISKTSQLSEDEKSQSIKHIEEWILQEKAFGTLEAELREISHYFRELFSELGLK